MAINRNLALYRKQRNLKQKYNGQLFKVPPPSASKKRDWEIPRKTLHSSIGFAVLYLYSIDADPILVRNYLLITFAIVSSADVLRFNNRDFNSLYIKVLGFLMRDTEKHDRINGVVYYLAGCIGVLTIFPKDIASISIIILSWCDTAASFFGRLYGHYTYRFSSGKSLAGTMGAMFVGGLSAWLFWGSELLNHKSPIPSWQPETSVISLPALVFITGLISGLSELADACGLDDNLVMPLTAGSLLWFMLKGLGFGS